MNSARFMGRMNAGVSHDLCNVLATIQQSAGLLEDYLSLARKESLKTMGLRPKFKYHDKFDTIINEVQRQVKRGQDICEGLSRLAHSPDEGQTGTDLGVAAELLIKLCERVAKSHRMNLEVTRAGGKCIGKISLIEALTALEAALMGVIVARGDGSEVRFVPGSAENAVCVDVLCGGLREEDAVSLARTLCDDTFGPFTAGAVRGGIRLVFEKAGE